MYAVISTDSLCRCQLRTPPVVPACPSHITSLYGPDQYSDPHPCTSLDLPHHITVSMSAPWHFLLWHICSTHRLLMRISDGCQDSLRPSGRSENFAFGSLLSFVFLQQYKPCFHLKLCCHSESEKDSISIPFLLILTLTPLMMSFVFRLFYRAKDHIHPFSHMMQVSSSTASQSENLSGNYFDRCIMNAFESITKVGGYMMMFSVLIQLLASALPDNTASLLLYSSLEISTGIRRLASSTLYISHKIILCAALTSFGGWCCIAQTYSMISGNHLPILPYIAEKLATALVTSLLISAYIYAI